jgi:hypothetical protein
MFSIRSVTDPLHWFLATVILASLVVLAAPRFHRKPFLTPKLVAFSCIKHQERR